MIQPVVIDVQPIDNYKLLLTFDTDEKKYFDVMPYISGDWYGKLKDTNYFKCVRVSEKTVKWKDGQDIAPHELYDDSIPVE